MEKGHLIKKVPKCVIKWWQLYLQVFLHYPLLSILSSFSGGMVKRIMDMIFRRVQFYDAVTVSFSERKNNMKKER